MPQFAPGQTLLIDADDTLWENNIYFERAIANYINYLDHKHHTAEQVRQALNQAERETILAQGYGLSSFTQSLLTCFERLTQSAITADQDEQIRSFAQDIADQEIELLPGVAQLIPELSDRHRLILMTKGSQAEQADKFMRSGLAPYFTAVEIVAEKNPETYHEVTLRNQCHPASTSQSTWMIGNSPKSDINPALAAGLNAVFIFHKDTWILEHAEITKAPEGQHLIEIETFQQLATIF
jgi:putative hydrolase of the HAD superfamily